MKRGYNELVGLQVKLSRVIPRYSLTHYYRWYKDGEVMGTGTMRGYDMHRHISAEEIVQSIRDAYAPAILSIWQHVAKGCIAEYYQLEVSATPEELRLAGTWRHWAQL